MWPRMLLDLLPHFVRLVPMADKYLASRNAGDKAQDTALSALSDDVRSGLGEVKEAQAGLHRQLREQGSQISDLAVEVTRARMGVETVEARAAKLEKSASLALKLLWVVSGLLAVGFAVVTILVVRMSR